MPSETSSKGGIVLTDAPPIPSSGSAPAVEPGQPCPRCGAGPDKRVKSAAFGTPHDVCRKCGFEDFKS